jgi:methionine-rich copper-binding protein CopC
MARRLGTRWRLVIGALSVLPLGPGLVWGHAFPERAEPRVGSMARVAPVAVRIWFDGELEPAFSQIVVTDSGGRRVDRGDTRIDPKERRLLQVSLLSLPPGIYLVQWTALSIDGHRTIGEFRFTVKGPD